MTTAIQRRRYPDWGLLYDRLYSNKNYQLEAAQVHAWIRRIKPGASTLLDMGCGTGRHLEYLQVLYHAEGVDINPDLLAAAQKRCPNVQFHLADLTTYRHPRPVDIVICLFSTIAWAAITEEALGTAIHNLSRQLAAGGVLIVEPWFTHETYRTGTITANVVDDADMKISWMYTSKIENHCSIMDIHYLVGTSEAVRFFRQKHVVGLFRPEQYLDAFEHAGIETIYDKGFGRGMYLGQKVTAS